MHITSYLQPTRSLVTTAGHGFCAPASNKQHCLDIGKAMKHHASAARQLEVSAPWYWTAFHSGTDFQAGFLIKPTALMRGSLLKHDVLFFFDEPPTRCLALSMCGPLASMRAHARRQHQFLLNTSSSLGSPLHTLHRALSPPSEAHTPQPASLHLQNTVLV